MISPNPWSQSLSCKSALPQSWNSSTIQKWRKQKRTLIKIKVRKILGFPTLFGGMVHVSRCVIELGCTPIWLNPYKGRYFILKKNPRTCYKLKAVSILWSNYVCVPFFTNDHYFKRNERRKKMEIKVFPFYSLCLLCPPILFAYCWRVSRRLASLAIHFVCMWPFHEESATSGR